MCEMFHCRPSELEAEDGLLLLQLMDIKHWRDVANRYADNPSTKSVSSEDLHRLAFLIAGDDEALHIDRDELTSERYRSLDRSRAIKITEGRKRELKKKAVGASGEVRPARKVMGGR
jgi:hypothetical protein